MHMPVVSNQQECHSRSTWLRAEQRSSSLRSTDDTRDADMNDNLRLECITENYEII